MVEYAWPPADKRTLIGNRLERLDGPVKSTGRARYASDLAPEGLLYAKFLTCPHAHARIAALDTSKARALAGVRAVRVIQDVGSEIHWAGDEIVSVAADSEDIARDAIRALEIRYEVLPHFVDESDPSAAPETFPAQERVEGDPESAFAAAKVVVERTLGVPMINHCCLEPHGQTSAWDGETLTAWASTQAVSTLGAELAGALEVPASNVRVRTEYMGGGFGSKFGAERWGVEGARLASETGRPVKFFLERDHELEVGGSRPSAWARIRAAADGEGRLVAWDSESWGSGGLPGTSSTPLPYVFEIRDRRHRHVSVPTNFAGSKAWRAPNHPQAAFLTMSVLEDVAAELAMDPLELFRRNLDLVAAERAPVYAEELGIAAELMGWQDRWRPRGSATGTLRRGLGLSIHTWGGRGHRSACEVTVQPDGSVEARIGTQDLGTGTRTVIAAVLADTFGLGLADVRVHLGDSRFPASGPSGGSSTAGGVSSSTRRAAQNALAMVFEKVAPALGVEADALEAAGGRIFIAADPSRGMSWREAASRIGLSPLVANGANPGRGQLTDGGVAGVQMAEVEVDVETGVVRVATLVSVQDVGLVVNRKLAESQVYGALVMGVSSALFEERVADPVSGRLLNPNMEFYKLAGIADVGEFKVHLMSGPGYDERGVIGIGEPPMISPLAAIGNAITNAIGARVTRAPFTPERVLEALAGARA